MYRPIYVIIYIYIVSLSKDLRLLLRKQFRPCFRPHIPLFLCLSMLLFICVVYALFPSFLLFLSFSICFCRSVSVLVRLSVSLSLSLCNFVCRYRKFLSLSHRASHIVVLFIFGITIWSLVKTV